MNPESISLKEAQRLILSSQLLTGPKQSPRQILEHLGYVQIDTISVIERAHHHVFWSRNNKYKPKDLAQLVANRKAFEYWSHAASYLPMKDYAYYLPDKKTFRKTSNSWFPKDEKLMSAVLKRIKAEGPLRSKDFENTRKGKSGWWEWKPAKKALERLFMEGRLEITRRESGFQKVYDLPERVIPGFKKIKTPTQKECTRFLIRRTLRAHGLASANEISYLKKKPTKDLVSKEIQSMVLEGELTQISVEGITEQYFAFADSLNKLPKANSQVLILSPFDNIVIQRKKLKTFFNFDYQIECYVPEAKRKYGYFSLPIFSGGKAVARVDCKADRTNKNLLVQSMHYEKSIDREKLNAKINSKLSSFAKFNGCSSVV